MNVESGNWVAVDKLGSSECSVCPKYCSVNTLQASHFLTIKVNNIFRGKYPPEGQ